MTTSHRPRRRFGQHFLVDQHVLDRIVAAIAPHSADRMLEIGPGEGALTARLLAHVSALTAIEIDRDLVATLTQRFPALTLIEGDALALDLAALDATASTQAPGNSSWRIVGNLPYNISTPLIARLLAQIAHVHDMHFLLQREVVDRLAATPGTKNWGRLSVYAQYHCAIQPLLEVPPGCFRPPPKVESAFVRLTPRTIDTPVHDAAAFDAVVRAGFQQRRKTLRNALRAFAIDWQNTPLPETLRPDQVDVAGYVVLANQVARAARES
jgi:16S rRNA (adenine1518-N6/adenine1519-N6)-dimethyltransferase